jgi:hypothetical protein
MSFTNGLTKNLIVMITENNYVSKKIESNSEIEANIFGLIAHLSSAGHNTSIERRTPRISKINALLGANFKTRLHIKVDHRVIQAEIDSLATFPKWITLADGGAILCRVKSFEQINAVVCDLLQSCYLYQTEAGDTITRCDVRINGAHEEGLEEYNNAYLHLYRYMPSKEKVKYKI